MSDDHKPDLSALFATDCSELSVLQGKSAALYEKMRRVIVTDPDNMDRIHVMTGTCQLMLVDIIKSWPGCPCQIMAHMAQWMGEVAAAERFHHSVVCGLALSEHPNCDGDAKDLV